MSTTLKVALNANNPITAVAGATVNALASGSAALDSTVLSNVPGDTAGEGNPRARLKLHIDSMAVSAGGVVDGWFLTASDGSVYEQGGASVIPLRAPDFCFVPVAQTAAVDLEQWVIPPVCSHFKTLIRNNALGAAFPANNNAYVKLYYETDTLV